MSHGIPRTGNRLLPYVTVVWWVWIALGAEGRAAGAGTSLEFASRTWTVREGRGGPGPNAWDPRNVRVDSEGRLHLSLRVRDGAWSCAELVSTERLGFGRYTFVVEGPLDRLDDHVVLGLFNYPTREVGPDATHEIDIEFARWGRATNPIGNFTVWPVDKALKPTSKTFEFRLDGPVSSHRFDWSATRVLYRSWQGPDPGGAGTEIASWEFAPSDAEVRLSRKPMPLHLNLWLFQGRPPKDGKEVEVVVRALRFEAGGDVSPGGGAPTAGR